MMRYDMVHDTQSAYRKLIRALSYPGTIVSLSREANKLDLKLPCYKGMQVLSLMLLDADTHFACVSNNEDLQEKIRQLTYCFKQEMEKAPFILVTRDQNDSLGSVIEAACEGTLEDPQKGATIIVECKEIKGDPQFVLQGPGIPSKAYIAIDMDENWLDARNEKNQEFPLGVDMIFVDKQGNVVALPRTTRVERM